MVFNNNSENGFSFVQVLFASSIVASLALLGIKLAQEQKRVSLQASLRFSAQYVLQEIDFILKDEKSCRESFLNYRIQNGESVKSLFQVLTTHGDNSELRIEKYIVNDPLSILESDDLSFKISKYEIVIDDKEYQLNRGMIGLLVEFDRGVGALGGRYLRKIIPLSIELNDKGRVATCRRYQGQKSNWKPWLNQVRTGSLVTQKSVVIGEAENLSKAKLKVVNGISFETNENVECNYKARGLLNRFKDGMYYCNGQKWLSLTKNAYPTTYTVKLNMKETDEVLTKPHYACLMTKVLKDSFSSQCEVKKTSKEIYSTYRLVASSSNKVSKLECEVTCFE